MPGIFKIAFQLAFAYRHRFDTERCLVGKALHDQKTVPRPAHGYQRIRQSSHLVGIQHTRCCPDHILNRCTQIPVIHKMCSRIELVQRSLEHQPVIQAVCSETGLVLTGQRIRKQFHAARFRFHHYVCHTQQLSGKCRHAQIFFRSSLNRIAALLSAVSRPVHCFLTTADKSRGSQNQGYTP